MFLHQVLGGGGSSAFKGGGETSPAPPTEETLHASSFNHSTALSYVYLNGVC
jgi:hypothetical protein